MDDEPNSINAIEGGLSMETLDAYCSKMIRLVRGK